jgi:peptidoglycan/LPS O-acetylase OafA/YrhL
VARHRAKTPSKAGASLRQRAYRAFIDSGSTRLERVRAVSGWIGSVLVCAAGAVVVLYGGKRSNRVPEWYLIPASVGFACMAFALSGGLLGRTRRRLASRQRLRL